MYIYIYIYIYIYMFMVKSDVCPFCRCFQLTTLVERTFHVDTVEERCVVVFLFTSLALHASY